MNLEQYLSNKQVTQTDLTLIEKLKAFSSESDFIVGVLVYAETEINKKCLLNTLPMAKRLHTKVFFCML